MATGHLGGFIRAVRSQDGGGMTDGQLLERFITRRDEAAFEALVRRHGPMVLGVCHRLLRHPQDAEDAFQATFLVLVRKAAVIGRRELVGNWLYGTACRAALEARALRRRTREHQVNDPPEPAMPETEAAGPDLRPVLDRELSRLPEKYRVPVVLCDLEGRTRRDAARQLGIPEGTLSGRLTTARRKLAKRLARQGLMLSGAALAETLARGTVLACVPGLLLVSTNKAAIGVAAGEATTAGLISAPVAALTTGVIRAMWMNTLKIAGLKITTIMLTAVGVAGLGSGLLTTRALADKPGEKKTKEVPAAGQAVKEEKKEKKPVGPSVQGTLKSADAVKGTVVVTVMVKGEAKKVEEKTFTLAKDAKVFIEDRQSKTQPAVEGKLADLSEGTFVNIQLDADQKQAISVSARGPGLQGRVRSADASKNTITVAYKKGKDGASEETFPLTTDAKVLLNDGLSKETKDQEGKLADLTEGMTVMLQLSVDRKTALSVRVQGEGVQGTLKTYDAGNNSITISRKEDGGVTDKTYPVSKDAKLDNLTEGRPVHLRLSVFDKKTVVAAQGLKSDK